MSNKLIGNNIYIQSSGIHGHGVFANRSLVVDEIIEECRCIIAEVSHPVLDNYTFNVNGETAIAFGSASLFNHSDNFNAIYKYDHERNVMVVSAIKPISANDEILISYGKNWFGTRGMEMKKIKWYKTLLRQAYNYRRYIFTVIVILAFSEFTRVMHFQG